MLIFVVDAYNDCDKKTLKEMHQNLNILDAIICEFGLNFDYYVLGSYSSNIIHLKHNLYAIIIDFEVIEEKKETKEDDISFLISFEVNANAFYDMTSKNGIFLE